MFCGSNEWSFMRLGTHLSRVSRRRARAVGAPGAAAQAH